MIDRSKKNFFDKETEELMKKGAHNMPWKALTNLGNVERGPHWAVMDMRPGSTVDQVAEELADHYSAISQEFTPITNDDIPITYDRPTPEITPEHVQERLVALKKPKSHVTIDLPAKVVAATAAAISKILAKIINGILAGNGWPQIWKEEEVTTIPKTKMPETFDEVRGISCTSIYSKLAETYMLDMLQEEVNINTNQYGGIKNIGTDHLLVQMSNNILQDLDDNRGAVTVMSIDYAKAFNRMNHAKCLSALAKKGSSTQSLAVAASFLQGRSIRTKIGQHLSTPRNTPGGAPQGTKSGNFFFTVSIDDIEEATEQSATQAAQTNAGIDDESTSENATNRTFDSETSFNVARRDNRNKPVENALDDTRIEPLNTQLEHEELMGFPPRWERSQPWILKYVDDVTVGGKNLLDHATRHITTGKERRQLHAGQIENIFDEITQNSTRTGMIVNPHKTQLMCVTQAINYEISTYINAGGNRIWSKDSMKVLGFHFDSKMNMSAHITAMKSKFAKCIWIIRHLK